MNDYGFLDPLITRKISVREWRVEAPLRYRAKCGMVYEVPQYCTTDLASIPAIAGPLFPAVGLYDSAAVLHDYLYRATVEGRDGIMRHKYEKSTADNLFCEAMESLGVGYIRRSLMYFAVSWFGRRAWRGNAV